MKKNLNGKIAIIIGVLVICLYGIIGIPHGVTGAALLDAVTQRIHLGLDLRGGAHLILQVVVNDAVNAETDNTVARIQQDLQTSKLQGLPGKPDPTNPADDQDHGHRSGQGQRCSQRSGRSLRQRIRHHG